MTTLPPIEIRLELETKLPVGTYIYVTTISYNGDIVNWPVSKQRKAIKDTWNRMRNHNTDLLIAFHLPVVTWNRIAIP